MKGRSVHLVVRTPRGIVADLDVQSLRVPTDTGQVGMRPGAEAAVTPVEPGLVLARTAERLHFIGTAGGLLRTDGREAELLTPLAVLEEDAAAAVTAVDQALTGADPERDLRQAIERLETGLRREMRGVGGDERR